MKITNTTTESAELIQPDEFTFYKDVLTINYGGVTKGVTKRVSLMIKDIPEGDKVVHSAVSCGCTSPKIFGIDDTTQLLEIDFTPRETGSFTKQITLYDKGKQRKQIIKLKGDTK